MPRIRDGSNLHIQQQETSYFKEALSVLSERSTFSPLLVPVESIPMASLLLLSHSTPEKVA